MKTILRLSSLLAILLLASACTQSWMDVDKTIDERADLLLAEMTLEEKVAMMHGVCRFEIPGCGFTIGKIPANERLGIPALHMTDGPAMVSRRRLFRRLWRSPPAGTQSWLTRWHRQLAWKPWREARTCCCRQ